MRLWFDTEFIDDGRTIDLISIGVVREDGREYYAECLEADHSKACPWVRDNVLPHLNKEKTGRHWIAKDLIEFFGAKPEIWAWYGAYDWVVLCQLYGRLLDIPKHWPHFVRDVKQVAGNRELPPQTHSQHHALEDARWTRDAWVFLNKS